MVRIILADMQHAAAARMTMTSSRHQECIILLIQLMCIVPYLVQVYMTHIIGITDFTLVLTRNFAIANRSCISGAYTVMIVNFQGGFTGKEAYGTPVFQLG